MKKINHVHVGVPIWKSNGITSLNYVLYAVIDAYAVMDYHIRQKKHGKNGINGVVRIKS